jgi:hypothetical protein
MSPLTVASPSQRDCGRQRQQDVNVVIGAADDQGLKAVLAGDSADERPQFGLYFAPNQFATLRGGKYAMN